MTTPNFFFNCPYCKESNFMEDEEYTIKQLKKHFIEYHNYNENTINKQFCKECLRKKNNGDLDVNPKKNTPFGMLRHMKLKKCYQNMRQIENLPVLEDIMEISGENNIESDGNLDFTTNTFNQQISITENSDLFNFLEENKDPQLKIIEIVFKGFSKLLNEDGTTNKMLELYLETHQQHAIMYGNSVLVDIIEVALQTVRNDFLKEIKICSPFDPNEIILENFENCLVEGLIMTENKKNMGVIVDMKYLLTTICQNQSKIINSLNGKVPLQLYCDEINMNPFAEGLLQYLHIAFRISGDYEEISQLDSIYTVALLPTFKLKNSTESSKYTHFFKRFKERFDSCCQILFENSRITFTIEELLGDHAFLDHYWKINAANADKGEIPSCRICLIPPNKYSETLTVESLEMKYPEMKRNSDPDDPIFKKWQKMTYSDWFHDLHEGIIPSSSYVVMQELCKDNNEFPSYQPFEISGILLKQFSKRKADGKCFQDIRTQLTQNIIEKKLSMKEETKRVSISFGSGYGNLEAMWCLHDAIMELLSLHPSEKLLFLKKTLFTYGKLCNICSKRGILDEADYENLKFLCNEAVSQTLQLTMGRYKFSKKLHYLLHYVEIAKNFNGHLRKVATDRFESKHQSIKKFFRSSNNKIFPAKTVIKKVIMRFKLSRILVNMGIHFV